MSIGRMLLRIIPGILRRMSVQLPPPGTGWVEPDDEYRRRVRARADAIAMRALLVKGEGLDRLGVALNLPRGRAMQRRAF